MELRSWSSLRWTKRVSWTQPLHGWWRICVTCCHLSLPRCSINLWTPAVSWWNSSRQSSDHFWRKTGSTIASSRISVQYPTCHLSIFCWRRLFRRVFRHSSTATDWCLECSLHAYHRFHSTETKVFSNLLVAADSGQMSAVCLLDLTAAFDTVFHDCCYSGLNASLGCVASC